MRMRKSYLAALGCAVLLVGASYLWARAPYPLCGRSGAETLQFKKYNISFEYPSNLCVLDRGDKDFATGFFVDVSTRRIPDKTSKVSFWKEALRARFGLSSYILDSSEKIEMFFVNASSGALPSNSVKGLLKENNTILKNNKGVEYAILQRSDLSVPSLNASAIKTAYVFSDEKKKIVGLIQGKNISEKDFSQVLSSFAFE